MISDALHIKSDAELDALIQALLSATGHQVYAESTEQTDAENLLCRASALRDDRLHERAAAEGAGEGPGLGPRTRPAPDPIPRHPLGP